MSNNINWIFHDFENYYVKNVTMPQNFPKEIMGEFLEPLQKLFLGRDLKQFKSLKNVNLKNVARKFLMFLHFKNTKKIFFILISLECCMLMRMSIGNDKRMVLFTEKVQLYLKENNWDMCINYVVDDRFSADSFNTFLKQHMPITKIDMNNKKSMEQVNYINDVSFTNSLPSLLPKKILAPIRNISPFGFFFRDHPKLYPFNFTVPIIDDCADVLMIDTMTILDLIIRQETDFIVVSQDKIFEPAVLYLSITKKGRRKITLKESL